MQTYIVEITGPNGNGWYEPILRTNEEYRWEFKSIGHWLDDRNPIPAYLIESLLTECDKKFAYNYTIKIKPKV